MNVACLQCGKQWLLAAGAGGVFPCPQCGASLEYEGDGTAVPALPPAVADAADFDEPMVLPAVVDEVEAVDTPPPPPAPPAPPASPAPDSPAAPEDEFRLVD